MQSIPRMGNRFSVGQLRESSQEVCAQGGYVYAGILRMSKSFPVRNEKSRAGRGKELSL